MSTSDSLTIDTPEQTTLELPLAGVGSRLYAFIYDSLIQVLVFFIAVFLIPLIPFARFAWVPGWLAAVLFVLLWFTMYWGYFAVFEIVWRGQTPGKRHAGIRVIKDNGRPIKPVEAIGRNLLRAIDGLPGIYAVGLISMIASSQNRRLGDYVAGTVVVHDKKAAPVHATFAETPAENASDLSVQVVLTPEELLLVETFIERRGDLPDDVRQLNAWQIAQKLSRAHQAAISEGCSPEQFIEAMAKRSRDNARFR